MATPLGSVAGSQFRAVARHSIALTASTGIGLVTNFAPSAPSRVTATVTQLPTMTLPLLVYVIRPGVAGRVPTSGIAPAEMTMPVDPVSMVTTRDLPPREILSFGGASMSPADLGALT